MRARFTHALALVSAMFAGAKGTDVTKTTQWRQTVKQYAGRNGKHNGRTKGAFGKSNFRRAEMEAKS